MEPGTWIRSGGGGGVIRSMTGYGAAERALPGGRLLRVEARAINHRHLSTSVRLPVGWGDMEPVVVGRARAALRRGRVSLSVRCGGGGDAGAPSSGLRLDEERVLRAVELLREACARLGVDDRLDAAALARLPGAWRTEPDDGDPPPESVALADCVDEALRGVTRMREAEGRRLEKALRRSAAEIASAVDSIEARAPERLVRQRDRLREQVRVLAAGADADEDRLAREVAYLAAKWDISEEIVRLRSHLQMFLDVLGAPAGKPAGKRLEFVAQEMNREANTIGAKANDAAISAAVVAIKDELERIREQAENVE